MEIVSIFNMIDLRNELFLNRITSVQTIERAANHQFKVIVCLLNLCDVHVLELKREREKID